MPLGVAYLLRLTMAGNEADVVRDEARRGLDGSKREAGLRRRETIMTDTQSNSKRQIGR